MPMCPTPCMVKNRSQQFFFHEIPNLLTYPVPHYFKCTYMPNFENALRTFSGNGLISWTNFSTTHSVNTIGIAMAEKKFGIYFIYYIPN